MIIHYAGAADHTEIWVWFDPNTDQNRGHRHDTVRLKAEPEIGIFSCTALTDFGLPVLQPQFVEFAAVQRFGELFQQRANNKGSADSFATVLATAALLRLTGAAGKIPGRSQPENSGVDIVARFESYLNRNAEATVAKESNNSDSICPLVPADIATDGIETGILTESEGKIYPAKELGIEFRMGDSAVKWAKIMKEEIRVSGFGFPKGFQSLDLNAAAEVLASINAPTAISVSFYADTRSPHHAWRRQSAVSYPVFAEFLTQFDICRQTIDDGRPLQQVLSSLTQLNKGQLKRLGKLRMPLPAGRVFRLGEEVRGLDPLGIDRPRRYALGNELSLEQLIALVKDLDTNWVPDDERSWNCLIDIVSCCVGPLGTRFSLPASQILSASKGNWIGFHAQLAAAYACKVVDFKRQQMSMAISDVLEMTDDFSQSVVLPNVLAAIMETGNQLPFPAAQDVEAAKRLAFGLIIENSRNPIAVLLATARRWLSRIPALIAAEGQIGVGVTQSNWENDPRWPKLAEEFHSSNGLVVWNLVSEEELLEESKRLSHCVGRLYSRKARRGECHIFSVRSTDGSQSFSTFEVASPVSDIEQIARGGVKILQHKARNNQPPGMQPSLAVQDWLNAVRSNLLTLHLADVRSWRRSVELDSPDAGSSVRSPEDAWSAVLGRNWQQQDVRQAVWNEWNSHILRGELTNLERSGEIAKLGSSRSLLTQLKPGAAKEIFGAAVP